MSTAASRRALYVELSVGGTDPCDSAALVFNFEAALVLEASEMLRDLGHTDSAMAVFDHFRNRLASVTDEIVQGNCKGNGSKGR